MRDPVLRDPVLRDPILRRPAPERLIDGLHPVLARVLAARGVTESGQVSHRLEQLLPPDGLLGIDAAATLLADALASGWRILVVGDFDADGATSSALACEFLARFGAASVDYLVPNRFDYGYGLTPEIVELAAQREPQLIITVDNGISSLDGVALARSLGIRTLVTDHHLAGERLPDADVIVNPNQPGCAFASKNLAGVGVIFYVLLALRAELRRRDWFASRGIEEANLADGLDLVALGTVADVVPLDHNNRILVQQGLLRMRAGHCRPGIRALVEISGRSAAHLVAADLAFAVAPRLNAAGRLDDMSMGIECLLARDIAPAREFAGRLDSLNRDRQSIEREMRRDAESLVENTLGELGEERPPALCLYHPDWHQGVVGILASRIKERLHRPVVAFAPGEDGILKGSARSIPGLHIRDVLERVHSRSPEMIQKFGGHAMAAGLSLPLSRLDEFRDALARAVEERLDGVALDAVIESDGELATEDLDIGLARELRYAVPWGQHFPDPVFDGEFMLVSQRLVGERHLKMVLAPITAPDALVDGIAFNIDTARWPDPAVRAVRLAYRLDCNVFRGEERLQLAVEHLAPA